MIRKATLTLLAVLMAGSAFAQTTVAVVDFEQVIAQSQRARTALGEVGLFRQSKQQELEAMAERFTAKQTDAQARATAMTEGERRAASTELQRLQTEITRASEDAEREVKLRANQVLTDLNQDLGPLVRQLAIDKNIDLVLQWGAEVGIVFAADSLDITLDVIAAYDASQ